MVCDVVMFTEVVCLRYVVINICAKKTYAEFRDTVPCTNFIVYIHSGLSTQLLKFHI